MKAPLPEGEFKFLSVLEKAEEERIATGSFDEWFDVSTVGDRLSLSNEEAGNIATSLSRRGLLVMDTSGGRALAKSKTAAIIQNLYHLTTLIQRRDVRDVSDLKYIRFVKQIPSQNIPLSDSGVMSGIVSRLKSREPREETIARTAIQAVAGTFQNLSHFQVESIEKVVEALCSLDRERSIVIQAETGAGKSLVYQLPLVLWVLQKKMRAYFAPRNSKPRVTPSALLLFPRNVLAKDQFDALSELAGRVGQSISGLPFPSDLKSFLDMKIANDYGGTPREERVEIYRGDPDVIVTNPDTLKRRMMDAISGPIIASGVDLVLYDEVHLYNGLFGAHVASLNSRLQNILQSKPVFLGMSATVASPQRHCQKLFVLRDPPDVVTDETDTAKDFALEHHVILKPRAGRSPLGVCVDATSCLLHNRRGDTRLAHQMDDESRPKTLCFVDSLDITGRWAADQRNYEYFDNVQQSVRTDFRRGYPVHFAPLADTSGGSIRRTVCLDCKERRDTIARNCPMFQDGRCWWFSRDSADAPRWIQTRGGVIPNDNIRVKRTTRQEVEISRIEDIYGLFRNPGDPFASDLPVDALVASPVLEVGVDFMGITEIVQYGEIRSPTSYKQKSGRGAREGNLTDGLFILTTIPFTPLSNFYYRHFQRLVFPSISPLPLEPRNPDILKSHALCSVFDFLACRGIDVFNIIAAKEDHRLVEEEFRRAAAFLSASRELVLDHIRLYLAKLGETEASADAIASRAADVASSIIEQLNGEFRIGENSKTLVRWIFEAFRSPDVMRELEDEFGEGLERRSGELRFLTDARESMSVSLEKVLEAVKRVPKEYSANAASIQELATRLRVGL